MDTLTPGEKKCDLQVTFSTFGKGMPVVISFIASSTVKATSGFLHSEIQT
jgi:hypothetical protein